METWVRIGKIRIYREAPKSLLDQIRFFEFAYPDTLHKISEYHYNPFSRSRGVASMKSAQTYDL